MKLRDFQSHTFNLCMRYFCAQTPKNKKRLVLNLCKWSRFTGRDGQLPDYGYGGDVVGHIWYCSDRMNQGRAKAILRLLGENP